MALKEISEQKLLEILNQELHREGYFKDCNFTSILRSEPDESGCNWSQANIRCSGVPVADCLHDVDLILQDTKKKFKII